MSRRRITNPVTSNVNCSSSESARSKRKKAKNVDGRCYYGIKVVFLESSTVTNPGRSFVHCPMWTGQDCKYFIWVDEIEGGWKALARSVIKATNEPDFVHTMMRTELPDESNMKVVIKIGKIKGEIREIRVCILSIVIGLVLCFLTIMFLAFKM